MKNDDHAEELSGQFEGDIILSDNQERALRARTGLVNENYRWVGARVPYEIVEADFSKFLDMGLYLSSPFLRY